MTHPVIWIFSKANIGKTHLARGAVDQIDNGQLAPDLAKIRTSITDVSNEITQTVNKETGRPECSDRADTEGSG
ncbi:hypothetical protein ACNKHU_11120 [Shigella flexneri]